MNNTPFKLCLAMIVRDEGATIVRCLNSILPFIDTWLVHDLGLSDQTPELIRQTLAGLPGTLKQTSFRNFSEARNRLLEQAAEHAESVIMIDADEELYCLADEISIPQNVDAGLLSIRDAFFTRRQARFSRSVDQPTFHGPVFEYPDLTGFSVAPIPGCYVVHHADGIRHRTSKQLQNDTDLLITANANDISPKLALGLAQCYLRSNQLDNALATLLRVIDQDKKDSDGWFANYLAGNIFLRQGHIKKAKSVFKNCLEISSDRAEPMFMLAEMAISAGDPQTAHRLLETIVALETPLSADYIEHNIYRYKARLLLAKSSLLLNEPSTARKHVNALTAVKSMVPADLKRLEELNQSLHIEDAVPQPKSIKELETQTQPQTNQPKPFLTFGMATHDDFHGVYFTVMSVVLFHQQVLDRIEILIVDNNPDSEDGRAVKDLCGRAPNARYIEAAEYSGTSIRERVIIEARGEFVLCADCHVFLHHGVLARLINYFERNPGSSDLFHGPLFYDNHEDYSTHMNPTWRDGFFGVWGKDTRGGDAEAEPFEIPLQGMGLFACRTSAWPGFNLRFRGFGGEEGYIHEKFRQSGNRGSPRSHRRHFYLSHAALLDSGLW